jgi:hypothetical protein
MKTQAQKGKGSKSSIMFKEHYDTPQAGKSLPLLTQPGKLLICTKKIHGTSHRDALVQVKRTLNWKEKLAKRFGVQIQETEWKHLSGTRRVVLTPATLNQYHDPSIRTYASSLFEGKLHKGETIYSEIVGFEPTGRPIMPSVSTESMKDKEFTKRYGKTMVFAYGCAPAQCKVLVYRITMTNEDGITTEYSWDQVVNRCKELEVDHVPLVSMTTIDEILQNTEETDPEKALLDYMNKIASGPSVLDPTHIEEGICVRVDDRNYKFKSYEFKVVEGIIKDSGVVDTEEAQG